MRTRMKHNPESIHRVLVLTPVLIVLVFLGSSSAVAAGPDLRYHLLEVEAGAGDHTVSRIQEHGTELILQGASKRWFTKRLSFLVAGSKEAVEHLVKSIPRDSLVREEVVSNLVVRIAYRYIDSIAGIDHTVSIEMGPGTQKPVALPEQLDAIRKLVADPNALSPVKGGASRIVWSVSLPTDDRPVFSTSR